MTEASKKISFFRSCFEADNRSPQLSSFFSAKVSQPKILKDADILSGHLLFLPVSTTWGRESQKILTLYEKEKDLFCCALFVIGSAFVLNKQQKLIAPLLLYPAKLVEEDEVFKLELTSYIPILNPAAIQPLTPRNPLENVFNELSSQLPEGAFRFQEAIVFKEVLDKLFLNLNTEAFSEYPTVASPDQIEKIRKSDALFKTEDQFYLVSAIGMGIINKARSGRGILNELDSISNEENNLSKPLEALLTNTNHKPLKNIIKNVFVPTTLNKAQNQLIKKSHESNLNIAVGPPGTGKSFTIAALTIDAICRGKSVLIATNNNQSAEVIAQKLENDFQLGYKPIKTNDKRWKAQAKQYLENILSGIGLEEVSHAEKQKIEKQLNLTIRHINRLEAIIQDRTAKEEKWGKYFQKENVSFWEKIKLKLIRIRAKSIPPLWELYQELMENLYLKNELLNQYLALSRHYYLFEVLSRRRRELQFFLKALRARTGNLKEERFSKVNFNTLFKALPIWLVTLEEISQVLPLRKELFDLVVFDEATQCNIASALPVIQRAKKAVIVGDPKQLRHISFLSNQRQQQLLSQYELFQSEHEDLDYRNKSLLDFALDRVDKQDSIHFLNEHYRSLPDLIAFSNQKFYNKALYLMTDTPTAKTEGNLHIHSVKGKKAGKGYNWEEAKVILQKINSLILQEAELPGMLCRSIGVLSPFREQGDYLIKLIGENIPIDSIKRHKILIGTPHFFQGEERDVMILSFALDNESHPSAFRYLEKADVFNVSITRARSEQHLYISFDPKRLNPEGLLKEYLGSVANTNYNANNIIEEQSQDIFMLEVLEVLHSFQFDRILHHYHISGLDIDIVLVHSGKTYCIDLVGYPGKYGAAFPIERIKMLERMEIKVFSISYLFWNINRDHSIKALKEFLEIKEETLL